MPIRPIDVMKSQEASLMKTYEINKVQQGQEQAGRNFQNMIQAENKKPVAAQKGDNKEYRYDAKEKGNNNSYGSGSKKQGKRDEKKETKEPGRPGGIDILI